ncbi:MAG: alkaline phosphatase family protein [Myxococcales bacterium]|nr:alkaline phosphatase family protein [Myxococcales bacterium]
MSRRGVAVAIALTAAAWAASCTPSRAPGASDAGPDTGAAAAAVDAATGAGAAPKRMLVVVSIDGLRHDYLRKRPDAAPTLARLAREGAFATTLRSVWPSVTYPAHTTLVTGVSPGRHGIVNNLVFDPFEKNDRAWYWYARDIEVPTLWDAAKGAGIEVGSVYWPVTVGAAIPYNIPQIWRSKTDEDDKLVAALSTPGLLPDGGAPPAEHRTDRERASAALAMIGGKRPPIVLVYLTDLDTTQHEAGPMSAPAWKTLGLIDGYVAEIVRAAQAAASSVSLAVVSDHGFVAVDREIRPNVALRRAGLVSLDDRGKARAYRAIAWKSGGTASIVLRDPADARTRGEVRALADKLAADPSSGIARVHDGAEIERAGGPRGTAVMLEAKPGFVFSDDHREPLVAPTPYRGHHGYSPDMPEMRSTLFFWGAGVAKGADLGDVVMVDVAPTLAALAGVALPAAEGKAIARALAP